MPLDPINSAGAVGDLGLSTQAKQDAAEIADKLRKKKMEDNKLAAKTGVPNVGASGGNLGAFSTLMGGVI